MFKCKICDFITSTRSHIDQHHIKPRSMGGNNFPYNLVYLCPSCHSKVYVEGSKGRHSIKSHESIVINGWVGSTLGNLLHFIDKHGEHYK